MTAVIVGCNEDDLRCAALLWERYSVAGDGGSSPGAAARLATLRSGPAAVLIRQLLPRHNQQPSTAAHPPSAAVRLSEEHRAGSAGLDTVSEDHSAD